MKFLNYFTELFLIFVVVFFSSSESEEERPVKKEQAPLVFRNKKEAMEAFKNLLRDKVKYCRHVRVLIPIHYFKIYIIHRNKVFVTSQ